MANRNVLLTVSLHNVSDRQKERFDEQMQKLDWTKAKKTTRTYIKSFNDDVRDNTREDVRTATQNADIRDWDALMLDSNNNPEYASG